MSLNTCSGLAALALGFLSLGTTLTEHTALGLVPESSLVCPMVGSYLTSHGLSPEPHSRGARDVVESDMTFRDTVFTVAFINDAPWSCETGSIGQGCLMSPFSRGIN